jgi:hypothetical protein
MPSVASAAWSPCSLAVGLADPGLSEPSTSRGGETVEVYILEVEVLEAKIAPGRGISLGGQ